MSSHYVVIGLGRLGSAMIGTLQSLGHEVLGIDTDEDLVQDLSGKFPDAHLITADATDESVLRDLNVAHFDAAAVVIGEDMGAQLARTMASPTVMDYVDLAGDEALAEANVPKRWVGKSLADLHLYRKSGLTVLALQRKESGGTIPSGDTVLQEGDVVVIGGPKKHLDRFLADSDLHRA